MSKSKFMALAAAGALAAMLALAGCGGSQAASSSAASASAAAPSASASAAASASSSAASTASTSAAASAASASAATSSASASAAAPAASTSASAGITEQEALTIALQHAGLNEADVTITKLARGIDDGVDEWEVEFTSGNREYDFDINANTGAIISYDNEIEDDIVAPGAATNGAAAGDIGRDAAQAAALAHAGVSAADCSKLSVELDNDSSPAHYDVDFKVGTTDYDYEVDAATGNVIKADSEVDRD